MSPSLIRFTLFLISLFCLISSPTSADAAMILPLFHSHHRLTNSSISDSVSHRRHLQRSDLQSQHPNARMRLYDDLLLNGYYTTRLLIGTPAQTFALIVDTGSTVTYVPCSTCEECGNHQDPKFQPELSSTYQPVKCNLDCTCDNEKKQCVYDRQYAEMSTSSGVLGEDTISFGDQSELAPQRAIFGCENVETGDLYSQHADGIMGLGSGDLSIVDQLVDKGIISDSFSLCYGGMDIGGGSMVLGGISPPTDMAFAHSDPNRSPYYNIELKAMHVAGKPLPLNPRVFDGKHGTVLDSGTTYAYLPEAAFTAFKNALVKELVSLKQIQGPDPNYNDICFSGAGSDALQLSDKFPIVELVFSNNQKVALTPENYLFRHSKVPGAYCLGIFQNGKDPTTLLGGIVVRNTLVMYDREHRKIGFWKTDCSDLWQTLHMSDSPPPAPSDLNNTTADISPSSAVDGIGDIRIGVVIFNMSLSNGYPDLQPHIKELVEFIAQELDVTASQVHLINFTSKGNDSLVRWAILPAGSAKYFSNATVTAIIAHLTEHEDPLPSSFGSYQFMEWTFQPPAKQTWWHQHLKAVVLATVVTLILGLAVFGIWYTWRKWKQSMNLYKPVDAAIPEQELQPL